jgi:hypothetical protein
MGMVVVVVAAAAALLRASLHETFTVLSQVLVSTRIA